MTAPELPLGDAPASPPAPAGVPASDPIVAPGEASPAPAAGDSPAPVVPPPAPDPAVTLLGGAPLEAPAAPAAPPSVPETYQLALPDNALLDSAALERISTVAKAIGLTSNEAAQALVAAADAELAAHVERLTAATQKGGAIYAEAVKQFTKDALADPDIGGTPERLAQTVGKAQQALEHYDADGSFRAFLEKSGWGSHPAVLKVFAGVHADMSEDRMVQTRTPPPAPPKSAAETLWPTMASQKAP